MLSLQSLHRQRNWKEEYGALGVVGVGGGEVEVGMCVSDFVVYVGGENGMVYCDLDVKEGNRSVGNSGEIKREWKRLDEGKKRV